MKTANINIEGIIGEPDERLESELEGTGVGLYFSAENMRAFLEEPEAKEADAIVVNIKSQGGDVEDGLLIHDMLVRQKGQGKKIITRGSQFDSIASVIFAAGDEREAVKSASPVIHNAWISPADLDPEMELNTHSLKAIEETNSFCDTQILGIYANVIPREKLRDFKALMDKATGLTDDQLMEYGFATRIIEGKAKKAFKALAYNSLKNKPEILNSLTMSDLNKEKIDAFDKAMDKLINGVKNLFNGKSKNMTIPLQSGDQLFIEAGDEEAPEGNMAYITNESGEQVPAPTGTYTASDGRVITIAEGGIVQSITSETAAEVITEEEKIEMAVKKAMEEKETQMKAEFEEKEKALKAAHDEAINKTIAQVQNLKKEFEVFKGEVPGDDEKTPEARAKAFTKNREEFAKMKPSERRLANAKAMLREG